MPSIEEFTEYNQDKCKYTSSKLMEAILLKALISRSRGTHGIQENLLENGTILDLTKLEKIGRSIKDLVS